ncbi:MAG: helicase, partial [Planctomycetota bacterium]
IQQLLPHLTARCEEAASDAERRLAQRGESEAASMREILETQQKHISETVKRISKLDQRQMRLDYGDDEDELAQVEANKRYWAKRLEEIKSELKEEPERIRGLYAVRARRIEPVGLVYLWPVTG